MRSTAFWAAILVLSAGTAFGDDFLDASHELYPDHLVPLQRPLRAFGARDGRLRKSDSPLMSKSSGSIGRLTVLSQWQSNGCGQRRCF